VRPAILVTPDAAIATGGALWFVKVSTQRYAGVPDMPLGPRDGDEFVATGLNQESFIHYTACQSFTQGEVSKPIGHLGPSCAEFLADLMLEAARSLLRGRPASP
jgi:mRNA-degrading endonuclease toxin of MazEF toxin-antitoxin module